MALSDNEAALQNTRELTVQGCKTACLNNCSCMAFAFINSNCKLWFGDLLSMQADSNDGKTLFIRLAASDVSQLPAHAGRSSSRVVALSISIPLGVAVLSTLFIVAWFIQHTRARLLHKVDDYDTPTSLTTFTYKELKIASRRNSDLSVQESRYYFPTWAATQIQKGNTMGIVDERIADKADIEEVRGAVMVNILCIQQDENGRPSMAQVVRMLEGILEGDVE
ncbi:hypothetical protein SUGI_0649510 [Cryptomeria japonica]|nr:hypothetical protein SUGI_0649510 [Cryptomeria japonica]